MCERESPGEGKVAGAHPVRGDARHLQRSYLRRWRWKFAGRFAVPTLETAHIYRGGRRRLLVIGDVVITSTIALPRDDR